jgi:hypothetical protein
MAGRHGRLVGAVTERAALFPVQASPDAPLIGGDRVPEAVDADRAVGADLPGPGAGIAVGRRMHVRVRCEAVQVLAPALLSDYKSPFTGARGADNPVVFAGFAVANSETGCGACTVTPG